MDLADVVDLLEERREVGLGEALDLDLDLGAGLPPSRAATRRTVDSVRTRPPAIGDACGDRGDASGRSTRSTRRATAGGIAGGRRGIGSGSAASGAT